MNLLVKKMTDYSDLIGIPFKDGGRDLNECDCLGLVLLAFKKHDISLPDYRISCFASELVNDQINQARKEWKPIGDPVEPCLIVLRTDFYMPDMLSHLGTYIGGDRFLHTMIKRNSCIERLDHPYFRNRIEGFYAYAE